MSNIPDSDRGGDMSSCSFIVKAWILSGNKIDSHQIQVSVVIVFEEALYLTHMIIS